MLTFTREKSEDGVIERLFDLTVAGERVPAVLWAPEGAHGPRPLMLMGHGGSQHKKIGTLSAAHMFKINDCLKAALQMP